MGIFNRPPDPKPEDFDEDEVHDDDFEYPFSEEDY